MAYRSFEDLEVWRRARLLVGSVYRCSQGFKDWSLRDQMRRCSVSIASNIAEGAERNARAEFQHFIGIAKGSAAELRTQLYLSMDLGFITNELGAPLIAETKLLGAQLESLRRSLSRHAPTPNT